MPAEDEGKPPEGGPWDRVEGRSNDVRDGTPSSSGILMGQEPAVATEGQRGSRPGDHYGKGGEGGDDVVTQHKSVARKRRVIDDDDDDDDDDEDNPISSLAPPSKPPAVASTEGSHCSSVPKAGGGSSGYNGASSTAGQSKGDKGGGGISGSKPDVPTKVKKTEPPVKVDANRDEVSLSALKKLKEKGSGSSSDRKVSHGSSSLKGKDGGHAGSSSKSANGSHKDGNFKIPKREAPRPVKKEISTGDEGGSSKAKGPDGKGKVKSPPGSASRPKGQGGRGKGYDDSDDDSDFEVKPKDKKRKVSSGGGVSKNGRSREDGGDTDDSSDDDFEEASKKRAKKHNKSMAKGSGKGSGKATSRSGGAGAGAGTGGRRAKEKAVQPKAAPQNTLKFKEMNRTAKIDQAMRVYKWWEEAPHEHGKQWESLEHNGTHFSPEYQPHGVKLLYDGKPVNLTSRQEEVATFYASMPLDGPQLAGQGNVFNANFFEDFKAVLGKGHKITNFKLLDFNNIRKHLETQKQIKRAATDDEKALAKKAKEALMRIVQRSFPILPRPKTRA